MRVEIKAKNKIYLKSIRIHWTVNNAMIIHIKSDCSGILYVYIRAVYAHSDLTATNSFNLLEFSRSQPQSAFMLSTAFY